MVERKATWKEIKLAELIHKTSSSKIPLSSWHHREPFGRHPLGYRENTEVHITLFESLHPQKGSRTQMIRYYKWRSITRVEIFGDKDASNSHRGVGVKKITQIRTQNFSNSNWKCCKCFLIPIILQKEESRSFSLQDTSRQPKMWYQPIPTIRAQKQGSGPGYRINMGRWRLLIAPMSKRCHLPVIASSIVTSSKLGKKKKKSSKLFTDSN